MRGSSWSAWLACAWLVLAGCSDGSEPGLVSEQTSAGGAAAVTGSAGGAGGSAEAGAAGASCDAKSTAVPDFDCDPGGSIFASEVVDYSFGPGQDTGQDEFPDRVLGPPEGQGTHQGSSDGVVSLGNGGFVVLGFGDNAIVDGPGADLVVFENAFRYGANDEKVFAELATVSVSADGVTWVDFPCSATEAPYGTCAGWHPVLANGEENELSSLDPSTAGGDAFDLAWVCLEYARFVKITDRIDLDSSLDGVFDLDAVGIVNSACDEP